MSDVIYQNGDVFVDGTRFNVQGKTYPINSIASVQAVRLNDDVISKKEEREKVENRVFLSSAGAFIAFLVAGSSLPNGIRLFGVLLFIGALYWLIVSLKTSKPQDEYIERYAVEIETSAGATRTYTSNSKDEIIQIVEAINTAIINRG